MEQRESLTFGIEAGMFNGQNARGTLKKNAFGTCLEVVEIISERRTSLSSENKRKRKTKIL